ncbi:YcaO-like family protein [Rhodococcoides kyotonense]|uniref:Ribosomal protein S12 methylthiotransferase accessory factor n=1 Tax=Rhodococcoides kyotonense TaxID=398843 RepID=A0A239H564_9NOCA|nr:YcaO-like family protein [Rhodococcus kyotonensis]SNS75394.1 ribosomal protein S12 methylthiotransferase accessory factor [Rhodococcus kyotonensis]
MTTAVLNPESLVDPVCGIIRRVREVLRPEGAPHCYRGVTAEVSDARRLGDWPADRVSLGTTFDDPAGARIAAIAEGVERYCGNFLPADLPEPDYRTGSFDEVRRAGIPTVDLSMLPTYAPWQYHRSGFPYQQVTSDTPMLWTKCRADDGSDAWLPASLIHLNWRTRALRSLPRVHHLNYAGIATGAGTDDAADRGLLEIIERDALEVWWHLDGPARGIAPDSVPGLKDSMAGCDLRYWLVEMPNEFAPAVAALVQDPATGVYAAGFSAHCDPVAAATKAVLEAVHTWTFTLGVQDADGWVFQAVEAGLMARGLYLDHREDRSYAAASGEHYEKVIDLGAHVQVWLDPRLHPIARRFTEPGETISIGDIPATDVSSVRAELSRRGHRIYTRDLTTSDIAQTTLRVVRTFVSGLVPNAPAAFGYYGMPRFGTAAVERGWRDSTPTAPSDFLLAPAPHM